MSQYVNGAEWGTFGGRTRYAYLTGVETRNGNTVTLSSLRLYFTMSGTAWGTGSEDVSIRSGGCEGTALSTTTVYWDMGGGSTTSNTVSLNDVSFSATTTQQSQTLYLTAPGGDCASFTAYFPADTVAPDKPTVSIVEATDTSITVSFGTESFGSPSTGTVYLYRGIAPAASAQVTSKTTTGQSTYTVTGLTTGTTYYFRARANNGYLISPYSDSVSAVAKAQTNLGFYGSVNSQTAKVYKLLGPVNSVGKCVRKLYGPGTVEKTVVSGEYYCVADESTLLAKIEDTVGKWSSLQSIYDSKISSGRHQILLQYTPLGGTSAETYRIASAVTWADASTILAQWGITADASGPTTAPTDLVTFSTAPGIGAVLVFRR